MEYAIHFSETGHLCLATLHATSATQTLERILSFFPKDACEQILLELSLNLRAIIAQRLIPKKEGRGRVASIEILINTPAMAEHIRNGNLSELKELVSRSSSEGMKTMDQALFELYKEGTISYEDALKAADSENDLRLLIKLDSDGKKDSSLDGVSII